MSDLSDGVLLLYLRRNLLKLMAFMIFIAVGVLAPCVADAAELTNKEESAANDSQGYRLGTGDVVNISVYGEDDLSRKNYRLPDSGLITFPFGEVRALGLSLVELESRIADGLRGGYLINPRVSVSIEAYRPFFINGQVASSGAYPYQPGMSVRKAVALAGGLKERASESKIFVMRETDTEHKQTKISMDGAVFPGDTITVEESFF